MTQHAEHVEDIEDLMIEDVLGPGSTSEIKVKQDAPAGGARISKNSKKIVFIVIGGLSVAILGGVLASGNSNSSAKEKASAPSESAAVGRTPPPSPPPRFQQVTSMLGFGGNSTDPSAVASASGVPETSLSNNKGPLTAQANNPANNPQHELSPAEKHRKWLEEQKYKRLEGNILSADSAQESGFGESPSSLARASQSASGQDDLQSKIDAIRAAANASPGSVDPALLARINSLGGGQAGQGAADPQAQNKSFVAENKTGDDGYLHAMVEKPVGEHELLAGSIIPAVLLTALDSDLPGFVTAMVRQTVYDSLNHKMILIPQGAKLVGRYSSDVAYGQSRALIAWNRLIFPNGSMIDLKGMSGTDGQGQSGFADQVDHHYGKVFGSSILMSLLGVGAQLSQPAAGPNVQPTPNQQAAASMATGMANTGTKLLEKNLGIQPTIKIRAGYLFNVMVNKSMIMPVYKESN